MRIAVTGTGAVGAALAPGLDGKDHAVTPGARDPAAPQARALAAATGAAVALPAEVAVGRRS